MPTRHDGRDFVVECRDKMPGVLLTTLFSCAIQSALFDSQIRPTLCRTCGSPLGRVFHGDLVQL